MLRSKKYRVPANIIISLFNLIDESINDRKQLLLFKSNVPENIQQLGVKYQYNRYYFGFIILENENDLNLFKLVFDTTYDIVDLAKLRKEFSQCLRKLPWDINELSVWLEIAERGRKIHLKITDKGIPELETYDPEKITFF